MRSLVWLFAVLSFISGGSAACFAQRPAGPRTLENLLNSEAAEKPVAAAAPGAAEINAGPKRPAVTVARPKDGVKHPDLDKAWADYDAAVTRVAEGIRAAIAKQFDAATAKGDLDAAEKWQAALQKFSTTHEIPMAKEVKSAATAFLNESKEARAGLVNAYEQVVTTLAKERRLEEARAVRDEASSLVGGSGQVSPQVASPQNNAKPPPRFVRWLASDGRTFQRDADSLVWREYDRTGTERFRFTQTAVTADYIEMCDDSRNMICRIHGDKFEWTTRNRPGAWNFMVAGSWVPMADVQQRQIGTVERNLPVRGEVRRPGQGSQTQTATESATKQSGVLREGKLSRPKDGVQHPELDTAWAEYEAAVSSVAEAIRGAISKQFDAATAKGDLDGAEKWQAALEKFEKAGELPTDKATKAAVVAASADYNKAREELIKSYENMVKDLTTKKRIAEAKKVREESVTLAQPDGSSSQQDSIAAGNRSGFAWSSKMRGWAGHRNANNTFVVRISKPIVGKCSVSFRLSASDTRDTNGQVFLCTPQGKEIPIATWGRADNVPITGELDPTVVARTPSNPKGGKAFSASVGQVNLQPGEYILSFRYQSGASAAIIEAVQFEVE